LKIQIFRPLESPPPQPITAHPTNHVHRWYRSTCPPPQKLVVMRDLLSGLMRCVAINIRFCQKTALVTVNLVSQLVPVESSGSWRISYIYLCVRS